MAVKLNPVPYGRSIRKKSFFFFTCLSIIFLLGIPNAFAQFRQIHIESADIDIKKISLYSANEGYMAFTNSVGYTVDTGHTFVQKPITLNNVNYGAFNPNLTFGFGVQGVKAFDKNHIIVYGDYALVPSILTSADGGNTFKLVYNSQYAFVPNSSVMDMVFPSGGLTGYAVDADRILKTIDGGTTWTTSQTAPNSHFSNLQAFSDNQVYAFSNYAGATVLYATTNGGANWQQVQRPSSSDMTAAYFLTSSEGWVNTYDGSVYMTTNGGTSWTLKNNTKVAPFNSNRMVFVNDSTGFALTDAFEIYKTSNSGKIWERLKRNNSYTYLGYTLYDLAISGSQFLAGGGHGYLELSNNGGGTPIPKALMAVDTTGLDATGNVKLNNYSKSGYGYRWVVNKVQVSSSYNATYQHNIFSLQDTVQLIVSNNLYSDTATQYPRFNPPVVVSSFTPAAAATGSKVTITGLNFNQVKGVYFGGKTASSYTVNSATTITAVVGNGASGKVLISTLLGSGSKDGFVYLPPPIVSSFSPQTTTAGNTITINGSNFTNVTKVTFGKVQAASYVVNSASQITAVLGAGSTGYVAVTTAAGKDSLAGFSILPVIGAFSPTQGTNGTVMHISGTGFGGATQVTIGGVAVKSFKVDSIKGITAIVAGGSNGAVTVTTPSGNITFGNFAYFDPPKITAFSPASGPVGTTVTISGSNFSIVPAQNIVYFGLVKGTVLSATATSLKVIVPVSAANQPITINTHNLISQSLTSFVVTFPNGGSIGPKSFTPAPSLTGSSIQGRALGDVDGDGKIDAIFSGGHQLLCNRNTGTGANNFSFSQSTINLPTVELASIALIDLDGDGKLDLVATNYSQDNIVILMNQSTPGNIVFSAPIAINSQGTVENFWLADMDGDGKTDILVGAFAGNTVSVLRNISDPGNPAFAPQQNFNFGFSFDEGSTLAVGDLNGDGKPEILCELSPNLNVYLTVLINNSTPGTISLAKGPQIDTFNPGGPLNISDLDGDGKPEITMLNAYQNQLYIYRNLSSGSTVAFAPKVQFFTADGPGSIAVADLDGDGKPDIALNSANSYISFFKNFSTTGNINFSRRQDFATPAPVSGMQSLDIDGDGKTDLTAVSGGTLVILQNTAGPSPYITSFSPTQGIAGTPVTITGLDLQGTTSVSFGGVPAASFKVNADQSITAVVGSGASGVVSVTNAYDTGTLTGFSYGQPLVITSFSPSSGAAGTTVVISGQHFDPNPANNFVYFGRIPAKVVSASATQITVTAPATETYEPITVTSNHLTAYTDRPFILTFSGGVANFDIHSFAARFKMTGGGNGVVGDLDGDGKPDMIFPTGYGGTTLSVVRNTSTNQNISFAPVQTFPNSKNAFKLYLADMDGDGKLDLVTLNLPSTVSVYLNTSTIGNINFAAPIIFSSATSTNYFTNISNLCIKDIDGDGKPDIITANSSLLTVSVYLNQTQNGVVSFGPRTDYMVNGYAEDVAVNDVDGDGKPDLLVTVVGSPNATLTYFKNLSTGGTVLFGNEVDVIATGSPNRIVVADIDGDGKPDVMTDDLNSGRVTLFLNTSAGGTAPFTQSSITSDASQTGINVADLNGDGKPDVAVSNSQTALALYRNTGTTGSPAFASAYSFPGFTGVTDICDMDGDGKPDLIQFQSNLITVLMNKDTTRFTLPSNNFKVVFTGTSCKGTGDGSVSITASTALQYTATITGTNVNLVKPFTTAITIGSLAPGSYNLVITIASQPGYQQQYTFTIADPKDLSTYATVNEGSRTLTLSMDGGSNYIVTLNGTEYQTSASQLTLALQKGNNELEVRTDKLCQGIFTKRITLGNGVSYYPNPFTNVINIDIGTSQAATAKIAVVNLFGRTVYNATIPISYGKIAVNLSSLDNGEYFIKLGLDKEQSVFKIEKQ